MTEVNYFLYPARGCGKTEFMRKLREELNEKIVVMESHRTDYSRFMRPERLRGVTEPVAHPLISVNSQTLNDEILTELSYISTRIDEEINRRFISEIMKREESLNGHTVFTAEDLKNIVDEMYKMSMPQVKVGFCNGTDEYLKELSRNEDGILCSMDRKVFF